MGHITLTMIKRTTFWNKGLKIQDMRKSWHTYDVINPWISNLGKILIYFQNPRKISKKIVWIIFTITVIKRTTFWKKGLKIEDKSKSCRQYDVINPWILYLGKFQYHFRNPRKIPKRMVWVIFTIPMIKRTKFWKKAWNLKI